MARIFSNRSFSSMLPPNELTIFRDPSTMDDSLSRFNSWSWPTQLSASASTLALSRWVKASDAWVSVASGSVTSMPAPLAASNAFRTSLSLASAWRRSLVSSLAFCSSCLVS